jgi:transposase-like protein
VTTNDPETLRHRVHRAADAYAVTDETVRSWMDRIQKQAAGAGSGRHLALLSGVQASLVLEISDVHRDQCSDRASCPTCALITEAIAVLMVMTRVIDDEQFRAITHRLS